MAGLFILSLDTEIAWGTDPQDRARYADCFDNYRVIIRRLLDLLDAYQLPATWAVVGHLFLKPGDPRARLTPRQAQWDWFHAPDVIRAIAEAPAGHEIGTHTFSHVCAGQVSRAEWEAELRLCATLHREHRLPLRSLAFPRNQIAYLETLSAFGITAYRGVEGNRRAERRGAAYLLHQALAIPPPTYALDRLRVGDRLVNLPASQSLLAYDGLRRFVPTASRVRQAQRGLDHAARRGRLFHLWFHPFTLGTSNAMFYALEQILQDVDRRRQAGDLRALTMAAAADWILAGRP